MGLQLQSRETGQLSPTGVDDVVSPSAEVVDSPGLALVVSDCVVTGTVGGRVGGFSVVGRSTTLQRHTSQPLESKSTTASEPGLQRHWRTGGHWFGVVGDSVSSTSGYVDVDDVDDKDVAVASAVVASCPCSDVVVVAGALVVWVVSDLHSQWKQSAPNACSRMLRVPFGQDLHPWSRHKSMPLEALVVDGVSLDLQLHAGHPFEFVRMTTWESGLQRHSRNSPQSFAPSARVVVDVGDLVVVSTVLVEVTGPSAVVSPSSPVCGAAEDEAGPAV